MEDELLRLWRLARNIELLQESDHLGAGKIGRKVSWLPETNRPIGGWQRVAELGKTSPGGRRARLQRLHRNERNSAGTGCFLI